MLMVVYRDLGLRLLFDVFFSSGPSSFPSLWAGTASGHVISFRIHMPIMVHRHTLAVSAEQTGTREVKTNLLFMNVCFFL